MNVVLLGGTKGMGRALARLLAARGDRLFLLGRDQDELARSGADLAARSPKGDAFAGAAACDLLEPEGFAPALERAFAVLGRVDLVAITAGLFATQDAFEKDRASARRMLEANFSGTVLLCEEARERLLAQGGGKLAVWSSVAGERGRKPVVLYGAAKAGLTRYLEGLDHRYRSRGLVVTCVKPGFVRTSMTAGLPVPPFAGDAEGVARRALAAIDRGRPVVYAPAPWALVMLVIRNLPRFVMRRVGF